MIVEEFMTRYKREYDFYRGAARLAAQHLEKVLKKEGIRAIVSYRAKSYQRLEQKVAQKCEERRSDGKKDFQTVKEIYDEIIDLAGVRIALYFPDDQQRVKKIINQLFLEEGEPKIIFPLKPASTKLDFIQMKI